MAQVQCQTLFSTSTIQNVITSETTIFNTITDDPTLSTTSVPVTTSSCSPPITTCGVSSADECPSVCQTSTTFSLSTITIAGAVHVETSISTITATETSTTLVPTATECSTINNPLPTSTTPTPTTSIPSSSSDTSSPSITQYFTTTQIVTVTDANGSSTVSVSLETRPVLSTGTSTSGRSSSTTAAIVGGAIGGAIVLAGIAWGIWWCLRGRKKVSSKDLNWGDDMWNPGPDTDPMRQSEDRGARPTAALLGSSAVTNFGNKRAHPRHAHGGSEATFLLNKNGYSEEIDEKSPGHSHTYSGSTYLADSPSHSRTPTASPLFQATPYPLTAIPQAYAYPSAPYPPNSNFYPPQPIGPYGQVPVMMRPPPAHSRISHSPNSMSMSAFEEMRRGEREGELERQRSATSHGMNSSNGFNEESKRDSLISLDSESPASNSPRTPKSPPTIGLEEFGVQETGSNNQKTLVADSHASKATLVDPNPPPSGSPSTKAPYVHLVSDGKLKPPPLNTTDLTPSNHRLPGVRSASEGTTLAQFDGHLSAEEEQKFWRSPDTIERKVFPPRRQRTDFIGVEIKDKELKEFEMARTRMTLSPTGTVRTLTAEKPVLGVVNLTDEDKLRSETIDSVDSGKKDQDTVESVTTSSSSHSQSTNRTDETEKQVSKRASLQSLSGQDWLSGIIT